MTWILPSDITSITGLFAGINTMLGNNLVAYLFLITIFSISFLSVLTRTEFEKALLLSSWITVITSFFSVIIFQLDGSFVIVPLILALISAYMVKRHD